MKPLKKGDAIGIFSPSSPATATAPNRFRRAKHYLEAKGYRIVEGQLTGQQEAYRSGTAKSRAEELNELIRNPEVRCIMSTIGGMNSNALLPYIDYAAFAKDPKVVVGYSDATAVLLALYAKTGITTFYGPALVASFGELPPYVDWTYHAFMEMTGGERADSHVLPMPDTWTDQFIPWEEQTASKKAYPNAWRAFYPSIVTGRLMGGNLNTLQGFWGSSFMPEILRGDILLIEDSLKDAATVERSFNFLKLNGVFDRVAGIVLGKHELYKDQGSGLKPIDLLLEVLDGQELPILADFDACHTHPMLTLPIGAEVILDTEEGSLTILNKGSWFEGDTH